MLKQLMIEKTQLITIPESLNCLEALELLESHQLRNAPILDHSNNLFRGNIYQYHIYKYKFHHPETDLSKLPVTHFIKNTTKVININASIYNLFFALRDLPYIAVLSNQRTFEGIIKHSTFLNYLAKAWASQKSSYILAIKARGTKGEFRKISRLINRYSDINMMTSFEKTDFDTDSFLLVTLPQYIDLKTAHDLARCLERHKYETEIFPI